MKQIGTPIPLFVSLAYATNIGYHSSCHTYGIENIIIVEDKRIN